MDIQAPTMPYNKKEEAGGNEEGRRPETRHNLRGDHLQPNLNLCPHFIGTKMFGGNMAPSSLTLMLTIN